MNRKGIWLLGKLELSKSAIKLIIGFQIELATLW
jgi:hypothetical protein